MNKKNVKTTTRDAITKRSITHGIHNHEKHTSIINRGLNGCMIYKLPNWWVLTNYSYGMGTPTNNHSSVNRKLKVNEVMKSMRKQRLSQAMDMRFYRVIDHIKQGHFHIFWKPGKYNIVDYFTKHHTVLNYRVMQPIYLIIFLIHTMAEDSKGVVIMPWKTPGKR